MKYIYLTLCLLLVSCTHNVRISTKNCRASGLFSETSARYKTIKKNVTIFGFTSEMSLKDILTKEKLDCRKVKYINYTWKQGPIDSLVSVIPFMTQKTLLINYAYE